MISTTITEAFLKQLLATVDGVEVEFVEVEVSEDSKLFENPEGIDPLTSLSKVPDKKERFYCQVLVPSAKSDRDPLVLLNFRGQVRFFNAYGCVRLIKELGILQATIKVTNPK